MYDIMFRKTLVKIRKFYKGTFDYDSPSAGSGCSSIGAEPHIAKEYKRR